MLSTVDLHQIHDRLTRVLGEEKAATLTRDTLHRIGRRAIETPHDLLLFAETLEAEGGIVQFIGRALKTQAILRGAQAE